MNTELISIQLFNFLSAELGSEEAVRTRRLLYSLFDYVSSNKYFTRITSGSKGEGLDMRGSDLDIMIICNELLVYESTPTVIESDAIPFVMSTTNTRPGFAHLQACGEINAALIIVCEIFENEFCLSHAIAKLPFELIGIHYYPPVVMHGPCVSPDTFDEDYAITVRCQSWIRQAQQWIIRDRLWPSAELVSEITDFGVLFVPIGCKGSPNEEIEWRISFSAAEKLLIHSFSHTQLLCYGLLKFLLKEIIDMNDDCSGLLCSYFLKTVVFWVSESLPVSEWRPDNLASCFMEVFGRLVYYVEYNFLPHYFIEDYNLFENRFSLEQHTALKAALSRLYQKDIFCMKVSKTVSAFFQDQQIWSNVKISNGQILAEKMNILMHKHQDDFLTLFLTPENATEQLFALHRYNKLRSNRFLYEVILYEVLQILGSKHIMRPTSKKEYYRNKSHYITRFTQYFPYLLCGRNTDAVFGWLTIATYLYDMKRYQNAIDIIEYVLQKCIPDKLYLPTVFDYPIDNKINDTHCAVYKNAGHYYRVHAVRTHRSSFMSSLTITELKYFGFYSGLPPNVYAQFLRFLCIHHSKSQRRIRRYLEDLQEAINDTHFVYGRWPKATSRVCLGIAHLIAGYLQKAQSCFDEASEYGFHIHYIVGNPEITKSCYDEKSGNEIHKHYRLYS